MFLAIQFLLPTRRGSLLEHKVRVSKESQLPTHAVRNSASLGVYRAHASRLHALDVHLPHASCLDRPPGTWPELLVGAPLRKLGWGFRD